MLSRTFINSLTLQCGLFNPVMHSSESSDDWPSLGARTFNDHPEYMDAIGDVLCQNIIPEK